MRIFNKIDPLNLLPLLTRFVVCLKLALSCVIRCLLVRIVFSFCVQLHDWPRYQAHLRNRVSLDRRRVDLRRNRKACTGFFSGELYTARALLHFSDS